MALSDLFNRRRKDDVEAGESPSASDVVLPTKALPKFLSALSARTQPVLLDLGPVVGDNVTFFGEQLGCKIFVEDIFADLNRRTVNLQRQVRDNGIPVVFISHNMQQVMEVCTRAVVLRHGARARSD